LGKGGADDSRRDGKGDEGGDREMREEGGGVAATEWRRIRKVRDKGWRRREQEVGRECTSERTTISG